MKRSRFGMVGFVLFCLSLLALTVLLGCAARQKNVTSLPSGVTQQQVQNWDTAVANLDKISQITSTLRQSVIALNNATVTDSGGSHRIIPDGQAYASILNSIAKVDLAQMDAATFLRAQPKNWGASTQAKVKNDIALITAELQTITQQQLIAIKNPSAVGQLQQLIAQISSAAAVIVALV